MTGEKLRLTALSLPSARTENTKDIRIIVNILVFSCLTDVIIVDFLIKNVSLIKTLMIKRYLYHTGQ